MHFGMKRVAERPAEDDSETEDGPADDSETEDGQTTERIGGAAPDGDDSHTEEGPADTAPLPHAAQPSDAASSGPAGGTEVLVQGTDDDTAGTAEANNIVLANAEIERALTIVSNTMIECEADGMCEVILCNSKQLNGFLYPTGVVTRVDIANQSVYGRFCTSQKQFHCTFEDGQEGGVASKVASKETENTLEIIYYHNCNFVKRDVGAGYDFYISEFSIDDGKGKVIAALSVKYDD